MPEQTAVNERHRRKAVVFDRDPTERPKGSDVVGNMQKLADADLAIVVKGDEAKIVKLRWADPEDYDVEVVRP